MSGRKRVNSKIFRFSMWVGVAGALLTVLAYIAAAFPSVREWRETNLHALSEITCAGATCDTSAFSTDWQWDDPDYVIDTQTRYFIDLAAPTGEVYGRFEPLDYSDTSFLERFQQPTSYNTPDGEVWRMYSRSVRVGGERNLQVMVGYSVKAPSKAVETPDSLMADVDVALRREADKIARGLSASRVPLRSRGGGFAGDGFQVVDSNTQQVVEQGPWLPVFLPENVRLPAAGLKFYVAAGKLYLAQTNTDGRVSATSFVAIAGLWWIVCCSALGFLLSGAITSALSRRFLRNYFAVIGMQVPSLEEARRDGESQTVEFKRGMSENEDKAGSAEAELLKSVAAFANTNDGVIFLGVDDAGHIKGLGLDYGQRDRLERKIHELTRTRIRPIPPVQITFEDLRGLVIAKIAVARGDAPLYMMGGTIYVRRGSSDVQAQPEDAVRLVAQYAF
ncbi:MAG: ATP-binding protein [Bryobacteraceae bacterium]